MNYNEARRRGLYQPHLVGYRLRPITGVMIHSTRGGRSAGDDGPGTENWGNSAYNLGAFWDGLVFESGQQVRGCPDERSRQPLWCAGYGDNGTWSAQDFYFQLELAQGTIDDPFPHEQLVSAAQWVAELADKHGFIIRRIPYLSQVGEPEDGICSHEDSANGRRLGKSDPGPMFPWDTFIKLAQSFQNEEEDEEDDDMADELMAARITNLENYIYGLTGQDAVTFSRREAALGVPALKDRVQNLETNGDSVAREDIKEHLANHPTVNSKGGIVPHTHSIGEAQPK